MACPQKENGYTAVANEIMEHLAMPGISGSDYRILLVVIRKTYGFNKKKDKISLSQFEQLTSMNRPQVIRTIKSLVSKRILLKDGNSYKFNKNWEEWIVSKRIPSIQLDTSGSIQLDTKSSIQTDTYKRKKDTITKDIASPSEALIPEVIKLFEEINPACGGYYGNKTQRKACKNLLEKYGFEQISKVVAILPASNKISYLPTITTPFQLWDKYVSLQSGLLKKKAESLKNARGLEE